MVIIIDHYDSFTNMLADYVSQLNQNFIIIKTDEVNISKLKYINPDHIILSPGPGKPEQVKSMYQVLENFYQNKPILGVCLGHQVIANYFGAKVIPAQIIKHGRISKIKTNKQGLFAKLPSNFQVTRYHSLIVDRHSLPPCLQIDAYSIPEEPLHESDIMAISHIDLPIFGLQYHPEALLTNYGLSILTAFFDL